MKQSALDLIQQINGIEFFSAMGNPVDPEKARQAESWERAVESAQSRNWESFYTAFFNRCSIAQRELPSGQRWNAFAKEAKLALEPAIAKVNQLFAERGAAWSLGGQVFFHLAGAIQEEQYSDLTPPLFFKPLVLPMYRAGYYVCGWDGKKLKPSQLGGDGITFLPEGKLVVF